MVSTTVIQDKQNYPRPSYIAIGVIIAVAILYVDLLLPLGIAGGIAYLILVLLGLLVQDNRLIISGGMVGIFLTIIGSFMKPPGASLTIAMTNRFLTIIVIGLTTYLSLRQNRYAEKLLETHDALEIRVKERTAELKDANEKLRCESEYIQLHKDIAVATNESSSVEDTMRYALDRICYVIKWPVGHLYFTESIRSKLIPSNIWHMSNPNQFQLFKKITEESDFGFGVGLPGRVMSSRKPVMIKDIFKDDNFPRAKTEGDIGVRSGFAFPILIGTEIVGIMEFFSQYPIEQDALMDKILETLENIGTQLGRVMERRRTDEEREHAREQMRQLYHRLELVREEERTRIAREVHDELGQVLTTLKLEFSLLGKKIPKEDPAGLGDRMRIMLDLVDSTIQTVKKISSDLRPPILDVLGLAEAIEWQGREFQARTGIRFEFSSSPKEINLEPDRSTTIFRIFQETLTNVARHSNANKLCVNLADKDDILVLEVKDNGKGITPEEINDNRSLGILGIRERALVWGGEVSICGAVGEGTTVTIKIKH